MKRSFMFLGMVSRRTFLPIRPHIASNKIHFSKLTRQSRFNSTSSNSDSPNPPTTSNEGGKVPATATKSKSVPKVDEELERLVMPILQHRSLSTKFHWLRASSHIKDLLRASGLGIGIQGLLKAETVWIGLRRTITKLARQKGVKLPMIEAVLRPLFPRPRPDARKSGEARRATAVVAACVGHVHGDRILDVGAGTGMVAEIFYREHNKRIMLVDVVQGQALGSLPVTLVADAQPFPFPDQIVDTVLLFHVLHYSRDPELMLRESMRVTTRRILVLEDDWKMSALKAPSMLTFFWLTHRVISHPPTTVPINYRSKQAWRTLFTKLGLTVVDEVLVDEGIGARKKSVLFVLDLPASAENKEKGNETDVKPQESQK